MIDILETFLAEKGIYTLTFILMGLGIFGMIFCGNYMKKIMCENGCSQYIWIIHSAIPFHEAYLQSLLCNELRDAFVPLY